MNGAAALRVTLAALAPTPALALGTGLDGRVDATAIAVRQGKAPVENWVVAGEKK